MATKNGGNTEPSKIGTTVQENEVIKFSELPQGMQFFLDHRDKVKVRFTHAADGREFPANHPVVKAVLFSTLAKAKKAYPAKAVLEGYILRCLATALDEFRSRDDPKDQLLDRETLVLAIVGFMLKGSPSGNRVFKGNLTFLREKLEEMCAEHGIDHSQWPKGSHLHDYLLSRKWLLERYNVAVRYQRKNLIREYVLDWIDVAKIPKWEMSVTPSDAKEGSVASPADDSGSSGLFHEGTPIGAGDTETMAAATAVGSGKREGEAPESDATHSDPLPQGHDIPGAVKAPAPPGDAVRVTSDAESHQHADPVPAAVDTNTAAANKK